MAVKSKLKYILPAVFITVICMLIYSNLTSVQKELNYKVGVSSPVTSAHFKEVLSELMGPPFRDGNMVKTLQNGEQIFPAMLNAIKQAQRTITFESYIYWSGNIGEQFVQALSERARSGVSVHVLIDWVGSEKIDDDYINRMMEAGVQVERYHEPAWYNISHMNNRTHRKLLIIDGKIGFTGGVGIADEWDGNGIIANKWRDTHYEVTGPVVSQMQSAFLDNWMKVRPEIHHTIDYFPDPIEQPIGGMAAQMFKSSNREGSSSVHIMYLLALAGAQKSIYLESAYFIPDDTTVKELLAARKRGVTIEIIVPSKTDSEVVRQASRETWGQLIEAGIRIFEYQPALFHCKVLVVDGYFSSIGSTNFDERSFNLNDEANLNVLDSEFASEQLRMFEKDKQLSEEVSLQTWESRPYIHRVTEKLAALFSSQF